MPSLVLYSSVVLVDVLEERLSLGSLRDPVVLSPSIEGRKDHRLASIANDGTATLWAAASSPVADFDFLWVRANQDDVWLQLTTADGVGGEQNYTIQLKKDVPFLLGSDDSYRSYVVDFGGGTVDQIDKILAQNKSGATAEVEILVVT